MAKVLFINPNYYFLVYQNARIKAGMTSGIVPIGLLCLAAAARQAGNIVDLLDLNVSDEPDKCLNAKISEFAPDVVGITAVTPTILAASKIAKIIKNVSPHTKIIVGGPHSTAMPQETLRLGGFDAVCVGEGEHVIARFIENPYTSIPGLWRIENDVIIPSCEMNPGISDLDLLPMPAYDYLDPSKYNFSDINSRNNPTGTMESSRGCYANCVYCNKLIHGKKMRFKSVQRVVDEMEFLISRGFREIGFYDDCFSADISRAISICEEILRRGINITWTPVGGLRVDRVTRDLLKIMKKSGCYRTPFGVESGSQKVLNRIQKRITLDQAENAVAIAKESGMETFVYFMLGLPGETEEDIIQTIKFAKKINPHYAKFPFTIPFPGTAFFNELHEEKRIKTYDWEKYIFSTPIHEIYDHENLSWPVLQKYEKMAYREFYFRASYIAMMTRHTLREGTFGAHLKAFLKTSWS